MSAPPPGPAAARRWESPWSPTLDDQLADDGLVRVRLLHQMRVELPLPEDVVEATRPIEVRPFEPADADEFLEVNNRAFEWHPDQGGWDRAMLDGRLAEPWFAPEGFLVHEGPDGTIDGFCWTKVHPDFDTGDGAAPHVRAGEIFVIAAHPDTHGTGLGRALTVAGLAHLSSLGIRLGLLYVEADNEPAVSLYERLGFRVHHSDAGYAPVEP